jgi:hypothetical protein
MMNHKKFSHVIRSIAVVSLIILTLSLVSNCKKGVSQADLIVLTMTETQWGLNYSSSMGHVEVFLEGESVNGILLASIEMKGDNTSAAPLKPETADIVGGNKVRALFEKNRILALLASPSEGSIHIVIVSFRTDPSDETFEVSAQVTVSNYVEDGETSPLTLEIDPDEWSLEYTHSAGTVEAFIRGEGKEEIDLDSIEMVGDNPDAAPLEAKSAAINNDHIHARFRKSQLINLLLNPAPGSTHTILVTYLLDGGTERMELSAIITIEGDDSILDPTQLTLEIDPAVWNLNFFADSTGTVEAFIRGEEGLSQIDLSSIEMKGDNLTAPPLAAISANLDGGQVQASFPMDQVLGLLSNPQDGSTHNIIISFLAIGGTERIELTAVITITDDIIDPEDLELEIDPDEWSLNYPKSSGTVEAFIEGEGIDLIDLDSIQMMGDNDLAEPLPALSAEINGDQIHARFPKNQVIDLLLNPEEGSVHTITISFIPIGGTEEDRIELTAVITIEEDDDDDDDDDSELSLKIKPKTWNMNYYGSAGSVTAQIKGDGIEDIDLDTIEMTGDSGEVLSATSAKLSGNHINADFPKSKVLDLLVDPAKGTTHTVTVTFEMGGKDTELTAEISIE